MNRIGVGMSRLHESGEAVHEALKQAFQQSGLTQADWLLVFITPQHIAPVSYTHLRAHET